MFLQRKEKRIWLVILIGVCCFSALMLSGCQVGKGDADTSYEPKIEAANFVATIDNPYLPFTQGKMLIYGGEVTNATESIIYSVEPGTKELMGVFCTIVRAQVLINGQLQNDQFNWYAQDKDGNVWYFGSNTITYKDNNISKQESWEAGVDGALPGIVMKADPKAGESYRQDFYDGHAEDWAEVAGIEDSVTVASGTYTDVLKIKNWSDLVKGKVQMKYYAEGVGLIALEVIEGGRGRIELNQIKEITPSAEPSVADRVVITNKANAILTALKNKDMAALASYVHPEEGLRFTPYSYIDPSSDKHFDASQIAGLMQDTMVYNWGAYDGTGDPIDLTFVDYYDKFVYDEDFLTAPYVVFNQVLQRGNSINNIEDIYPQGVSVEYHFSGFDEQYGGMDWKSLKPVFEQYGTDWYLVGIIHEQWTI